MSKLIRLAAALGLLALAWGDRPAQGQDASLDEEILQAPVEVDGVEVFLVRGTSAFPAEKRAAGIASRIRALARDRGFAPESLRQVEMDVGIVIRGGPVSVLTVTDADARALGLNRQEFADACVRRITQAIQEYRGARRPRSLLNAWLRALAATVAAVGVAALFLFLMRRLRRALERRSQKPIEAFRIQSFELIGAERIRNFFRALPTAVTAVGLVLLVLAWLRVVLNLFPWTRHIARRMGSWIFSPLETIGSAVVAKILIFLAILFLVIRAILKLLRLFFDAVGRKEIKFASFDPEWAEPTYKLVRLAVVAFAAIVAYPYIPGSNTDAFKGVTIFLGIVASLGSTSAISNVVAGYTMIYRRAFHVGDRVRIGDVTGDVSQIRLQVTHLRTAKNEEVIVPNSTILRSEVINYSSFVHSKGLILHTQVRIGYETPWRQVEAILLLAADRTPGLMKEPPPFVLQRELGTFAVTYELNVYSADAHAIFRTLAALHRSILDLFNEHGVQIMTPAYEGDPESPKVVPKTRWYESPAGPDRGQKP